MCANVGFDVSDIVIGNCVQLRIDVESSSPLAAPANVAAVPFWKNSRRASVGFALVIVSTPWFGSVLPNWNRTLRILHAASVAASWNTMLPQSPACGVDGSVGVVSPPKFGLSSRRDVKMTRPVVLLLPMQLSAPLTLNRLKLLVGFSTTCG